MFNATIVGLVIIGIAVIIGAAIAYSFIKKKKSYDPEGIPKMVNDTGEGEGSSKTTKEPEE